MPLRTVATVSSLVVQVVSEPSETVAVKRSVSPTKSSALSLLTETVVCELLALISPPAELHELIVAQPTATMDAIAVHTANKVLFFIKTSPSLFFYTYKQQFLLFLPHIYNVFSVIHIKKHRKRQTQHSAPAINYIVLCTCYMSLTFPSCVVRPTPPFWKNYNTKQRHCQYPFLKICIRIYFITQ
jgi:hypothetical protein